MVISAGAWVCGWLWVRQKAAQASLDEQLEDFATDGDVRSLRQPVEGADNRVRAVVIDQDELLDWLDQLDAEGGPSS